jgi:hypothetical protein
MKYFEIIKSKLDSLQVKGITLNDVRNHVWYVPFIGWIYPMAFKKDDAFATHHAKQGFVMAVFFTVILVGLAVSTVFIPISLRVVKLVIVILIYLTELVYLSLCIRGTLMLKNGEQKDIPLFDTYARKLEV